MTEKIEDDTRKSIAIFLPDAIGRALTSYHIFSQQETSDDAKEFTAHHNACKVAIAHIELLIKLAKWADLPDASAEDGNQQILIAAMLQEAREEVDAHKKRAADDK